MVDVDVDEWAQLVRDNDKLIRRVCWRYSGACGAVVSFDDLLQEGRLAVWRAAQSFDASAGKSWRGWAAWYIAWACRDALGLAGAEWKRHGLIMSFDDVVPGTDDVRVSDTLADETLPDVGEGVEAGELAAQVRTAVGRLKSDRQRRVVQAHDLDGDTLAVIAQREGVSIQQVATDRKKGLATLRWDKRLQEVAAEFIGRCYRGKGVTAFMSSGASVVEDVATWHMDKVSPSGISKR